MINNKDNERELSVSGIVKNNEDYIFVVRNPEQWKKDEAGNTLLTFGTIEGKVKKGETVENALRREFMNDMGADVRIVNSETSHIIHNNMIDEMSMVAKSNRPLYVYKDEKIENNKKKYNYTYSFLTEISQIDAVNPGDKLAVLMMNKQLLSRAAKGKLSVKDFRRQGGRIISNVALPEDALLSPTPSSKGIYLCGQCR